MRDSNKTLEGYDRDEDVVDMIMRRAEAAMTRGAERGSRASPAEPPTAETHDNTLAYVDYLYGQLVTLDRRREPLEPLQLSYQAPYYVLKELGVKDIILKYSPLVWALALAKFNEAKTDRIDGEYTEAINELRSEVSRGRSHIPTLPDSRKKMSVPSDKE